MVVGRPGCRKLHTARPPSARKIKLTKLPKETPLPLQAQHLQQARLLPLLPLTRRATRRPPKRSPKRRSSSFATDIATAKRASLVGKRLRATVAYERGANCRRIFARS